MARDGTGWPMTAVPAAAMAPGAVAAPGPSYLDPALARPALRRLTLVALGWTLALFACTAVGLAGLVVHRGSMPAAPPGGRVARGVVRDTMTYGEATVYEVRLRGGRKTVVVPGTEVELHEREEVYVQLDATGRPTGAEPVSWWGMGMMVVGGVAAFFALLGFLGRVPSAIKIRQQFATGMVLSNARASGSAPKVSVNVGRTILASLVAALFGGLAVAMRRRYPEGQARLQMTYPGTAVLYLEAPRKVPSLQGAPVYVPIGIPVSTTRGVFDARDNRIIRVRRNAPR
ncbi:MAG: hypothetical protein ACTHN0_07900 [Aquihabitans sp.]